jgi:hypothetical protein
MKPAKDRIYELLPAVYRLRDAAEGEPLKALLGVIAEKITVLEEDLAQLYDDQFIETCAPWVAPYIGDLIGYRPLHGVVPRISSPRAEIANTISYRRRKGTAAVLEQLARDVTGWHACVVEFFQRLATTQHLNHVRRNGSADLRQWEPLEYLDTPFDRLSHTADVRRIAIGRGRTNISNVGIFVWRLNSYAWTDVQPRQLDARRYRLSPLGIDVPLFTRPVPKNENSGLSTRLNVPDPIRRRTFREYREDYYGAARSVSLTVDGVPIAASELAICDLSDTPSAAWAQHPSAKIGLDPVLGRIAFPSTRLPPSEVRATFHQGFSSDVGGGEYDRGDSVPEEFSAATVWQVGVSANRAPIVGELFTTLHDAIAAWHLVPAGTTGVISVLDNSSYAGDVEIALPDNGRLLIIAAEWPELPQSDGSRRRVRGRFTASGCRTHVRGNFRIRDGGGRHGQLRLNGLLIEGALVVESGSVEELSLRHCTMVPGRGFSPEGYPQAPRDPSITILDSAVKVEVDHCITGGLRLPEDGVVSIADSIVDATSRCGVAIAGPDGHRAGGTLRIENSTLVGKVHVVEMELASNAIFFARLAVHDSWAAPLICARRQSGCIRFSFVPLNAQTPRRYQCHPREEEDGARVTPQFTSLRYGEPGYAQLSARCAPEIFRGADDGSEMGAFHELFAPQRITNLNVRLDEYLRFGLEAGIIFEPRLVSRPLVPNAYSYMQWVDLCDDAQSEALPGIGAGLI